MGFEPRLFLSLSSHPFYRSERQRLQGEILSPDACTASKWTRFFSLLTTRPSFGQTQDSKHLHHWMRVTQLNTVTVQCFWHKPSLLKSAELRARADRISGCLLVFDLDATVQRFHQQGHQSGWVRTRPRQG